MCDGSLRSVKAMHWIVPSNSAVLIVLIKEALSFESVDEFFSHASDY